MSNGHASWADDAHSIDYRHLGTASDPASFDFTAQHLATMAGLNRFDVSEGQDEVLFGLRGCQVAHGGGAFADVVRLAEAVPDHVNFQCVLGVWKRSTNQ